MLGFVKALKDIRSVYGAFPVVLAALNNYVFPVMPITPLLRPKATLLVVVFGTFASLEALSYSSDVPKDPSGNARLRKSGIGLVILGLIYLFVYVVFSSYFEEHNPQTPVLNHVVDLAQAALFAFPWALWSASLVLVAPRK
jgi:hypothetical protein